VNARESAGETSRFQSAVEGHVLVKNSNNTLPLRAPTVLSLFGYDAVGGKNSSSDPLFDYGTANTQHYKNGLPFTILDQLLGLAGLGDPARPPPQVALDGTMLTGGGSGAITPASSISPYDAFLEQAKQDNTTLHADFMSQTPSVEAPLNPCIVFINAQSVEAWDRSELQNVYSDDLVVHVADRCQNTIVVIHNAGIRLVDSWIDHPNVTAVIFAHLPGENSGNALVEVMYGRQSPSGRLPYTVARTETDYGSLLEPDFETPGSQYYSQSDFDEGLLSIIKTSSDGKSCRDFRLDMVSCSITETGVQTDNAQV
jgi:beta-glucosidase